MIAIMSALVEALAPLVSQELELAAGSTLFRKGDAVRYYYLVRAGCVHLVRWGVDGTSAVMQRASAGSVVAESSVFGDAYHCDALCVTDAVLGRADMPRVRATLESEPRLLRNLAEHLGREVRLMRARVELLARRTVAERLNGWLALNGDSLPERGQWSTVAEDIGVSPEAFYRELQRRRSSE
jgi:CRP-like cAMP-binding protein